MGRFLSRSSNNSNVVISGPVAAEDIAANDIVSIMNGQAYWAGDPRTSTYCARPASLAANMAAALAAPAEKPPSFTLSSNVAANNQYKSSDSCVLSNGNVVYVSIHADNTARFIIYDYLGNIVVGHTSMGAGYAAFPSINVHPIAAGGFYVTWTASATQVSFAIYNNTGSATTAATSVRGAMTASGSVASCVLSNGNLAVVWKEVSGAAVLWYAIYNSAGATIKVATGVGGSAPSTSVTNAALHAVPTSAGFLVIYGIQTSAQPFATPISLTGTVGTPQAFGLAPTAQSSLGLFPCLLTTGNVVVISTDSTLNATIVVLNASGVPQSTGAIPTTLGTFNTGNAGINVAVCPLSGGNFAVLGIRQSATPFLIKYDASAVWNGKITLLGSTTWGSTTANMLSMSAYNDQVAICLTGTPNDTGALYLNVADLSNNETIPATTTAAKTNTAYAMHNVSYIHKAVIIPPNLSGGFLPVVLCLLPTNANQIASSLRYLCPPKVAVLGVATTAVAAAGTVEVVASGFVKTRLAFTQPYRADLTNNYTGIDVTGNIAYIYRTTNGLRTIT